MDDEYVVAAKKSFEALSLGTIPGIYLVEYFPLLKYLPGWFPGMNHKALVDEYLPHVGNMRDNPYVEVKAALVGVFHASSLRAFRLIRNLGRWESAAVGAHLGHDGGVRFCVFASGCSSVICSWN